MKKAAGKQPRSRAGERSTKAGAARVFIVGTGRLGGALALALAKSGWAVATEQRTATARRAAAKRGLPTARFGPSEADVVLLCARDPQIAPLAEKLAPRIRPGQVVAHCAGGLSLEPLAPARQRGAHVGSLHPLVAVPTPATPLKGSATVDGDATAVRHLQAVARGAGLEPVRIHGRDRALYHAAAVLAANGTVSLADEAARLLGRFGIPPEQALRAAVGLIRSSADALEREGLPGALTGPVARGDLETVQRHFDALFELDNDPGHALYRAICFNLIRLAQEAGETSAHQLLAIFAQVLHEQRRGYEKYKVLAHT